jgi:EAL domain-containing protein (putative c-di-GMP-specific phosphodiesterase class I)
MGAVSRSRELGLALRLGSQQVTWVDPSGIRGVLRHHLARGVAALILGAAIAGILGDAGRHLDLFAVASFAAGQILLQPTLDRLGRRFGPDVGLRIGIVGWLVAVAVLVGAGHDTSQNLFEVVAVVGFACAMFVALTESREVAVAWAAAAAALTTLAAIGTGAPRYETFVIAGSIGAGALAGDRLREALEGFLGARRRLIADVSHVPVSPDPFVTAELLLEPLLRWTPLESMSITWFRADGTSVFLAVHGNNLPSSLASGLTVPEERNAYFRSQAQNGPWISGWTVRDDDAGYSKGVAAAGIKAAVYVPLVHEGRVIGIVGAGLTDRGDDRSAMAEYIPTLVQFADAAAVALGPALEQRDRDSWAHRLIDEILELRAYWPVFQAVRRLADGRLVGYEALTRFEATWTPSQVFAHARAADRLRELEVATLGAAAEASPALPADVWLSVNCSPDLLVDTDALAAVLAPVHRDIVLELSEQDAISDYSPIAEAVARLGPRFRLAVDDAGAGFSSLRHILEVRPQLVKLDLGLVQGVATDLTRTALIAGFVRFAADAHFELIAEGIETEADYVALRHLGVELGQGYLLGRPELADRLARSMEEPLVPRGLARVETERSRASTRRPAIVDPHMGTIRDLSAP